MMEILTLINEIVKQIRDLCSSFSPEQEATFDEIETKVREVMLEIGRRTIETIIRVRGTGYTNETIQTPSGEIAEYRENRTRTIKTLMGPVEIQRAYYHIGKGKGGYVPLDKSLSLPQEQYSYAVQEQMSLYAIEDSYEESAKKLRYTFPVEASGSTVRRIIQERGKEIYQEEVAKVAAIFSHKQPVPDPEIESVQRGYVGADGVMVPTVEGYREMKVATTYDTSFARETVADNLYYNAVFADAEVFGEHLWVMLKERGIYDAVESVWGCDGAKWIWKQKQLHDPDGKEIVDYIHASEYLQKVANAIHGVDTDKSQKCWGCMKFLLRRCGGESVLDGLKGFSEIHTSKELDEAITYFQNNHSRMDYPTYEKKGYHITSSTTESACRHVVGDRLKRSGMRWTTEGAQYTTMLRLKWKNGKWTDFWMRYRPDLAA
jgi:hypothetical protein